MVIKNHERTYDIVVLGATGYTGQLAAEHIAAHLPTNLKWAVAGRSESKLQAVIDACKVLNPDRTQPDIQLANVNNEETIRALARSSFALISAVGPYCKYGESVFKACAELGTHYFDCTGEVPWVNVMIQKYEETARKSGALMFPQIGVESAPPDLCTWVLANHLRTKLGAQTKDVVVSIHELDSAPSGGTLATVLSIFDHFSVAEMRATRRPFALSPIPHPEQPRPAVSIMQRVFGVHTVRNLGLVTTSLAGQTDIPVIERTWGLLKRIPSREEQFYGPKFNWAEAYKVRNWLHGVGVHFGLLVGTLLLAFVPPFRSVMRKLVYQPGEGKSREAMQNESVEYRGVANPDTEVPTGKQAFVRARFNGSLYYLTGLFLAQAALTVLEDDTGLTGGVYTPACLGQAFVDRTHEAGFKMDVKLLDV